MKKLFFILLLALIISSCSKEEEKLQLFSPEAFAYSLDGGWELNASCRVKGFTQNEINEQFKSKLSFSVNIQTPQGNILEVVDDGLIDKSEKEKVTDLPVETQLEMDSSYVEGKYYVIFHLTDDYSHKTAEIKKEFELTK